MDSFRAKRSLDNICDECLHSKAYIGKNPFGGYATTRKYVIFPSMALNTSQPLANHSPTYKPLVLVKKYVGLAECPDFGTPKVVSYDYLMNFEVIII
jgi:hypothetical protein